MDDAGKNAGILCLDNSRIQKIFTKFNVLLQVFTSNTSLLVKYSNLDDYFKYMQHTGQRPVTHHNPVLQDWVTTNWNMRDHFSICQWCPPNLVDRKQYQPADHIPVKITISDQDHSASGTISKVFILYTTIQVGNCSSLAVGRAY
jgi:hypothetical protein